MNEFEELRSHFPAAENGVFLDIAYDNSGSDLAAKAVSGYVMSLNDTGIDQIRLGGGGRGESARVVAGTRKLIADFIGAESEKLIAFTKNTNEGISHVLLSYPYEKGDNIITCDMEYPNVIISCLSARRLGAEVRIVKSRDGFSVTPEELMAAADDRTRFIVVSHVQSPSGYKIDLKKLTGLAHAKGIYVVVDAIQSIGFTDFKIPELCPDAVSAGGYKGLLAIDGIGFLYCRRELLLKLTPFYLADSATVSLDREAMEIKNSDPACASKFENSSMNIAGIYAVNAGLSALKKIGMDKVEAHIAGLFLKLHDGLSALGFNVITPRDRKNSSHTVSVVFPDPAEAKKFFLSHDIHLSLSGGRFIRMSLAPFSSEEDVEKTLAVAALYRDSLR